MLVRGRAGDTFPTDIKERAGIAMYLGSENSEEFVEEYRRSARRARAVVERVFYDWEPRGGAGRSRGLSLTAAGVQLLEARDQPPKGLGLQTKALLRGVQGLGGARDVLGRPEPVRASGLFELAPPARPTGLGVVHHESSHHVRNKAILPAPPAFQYFFEY